MVLDRLFSECRPKLMVNFLVRRHPGSNPTKVSLHPTDNFVPDADIQTHLKTGLIWFRWVLRSWKKITLFMSIDTKHCKHITVMQFLWLLQFPIVFQASKCPSNRVFICTQNYMTVIVQQCIIEKEVLFVWVFCCRPLYDLKSLESYVINKWTADVLYLACVPYKQSAHYLTTISVYILAHSAIWGLFVFFITTHNVKLIYLY